MIPAIILAAGLGTRLGPLSLVRAKAALPVGGDIIARRLLRQLKDAGVTEAVLNLHHLPESIASRVGDGADIGIKVRYSWESPVLGAAGGPRKASALLDARTVLVVNGDTVTDVDLEMLVAAHRRSGAQVTLTVVPNPRPDHYSGIGADADGRFVRLIPRGASEPSLHLIGLQVVETRVYDGLELGTPVSSVWPTYQSLADTTPGAVRVYECEASFIDVGTPADYVDSCRKFATHKDGFLERGQRVSVHATAQVEDVIAWDDVVIEAGAQLRRTIVTDGVRVPSGTRWDDVILRRPTGPLARGEQMAGDLAVTPLTAD